MNLLTKKPDWQITNQAFLWGDETSHQIHISGLRQFVGYNHIRNLRTWFSAQNLQTFASETLLIISLSCMTARKFARNCSQSSKFYERRNSLCFNNL